MTRNQAKKLKVGDNCLCISSRYWNNEFTAGKVYKTSNKRGQITYNGEYVDFIDNYGHTTGLYHYNIELIDTELGKILYE